MYKENGDLPVDVKFGQGENNDDKDTVMEKKGNNNGKWTITVEGEKNSLDRDIYYSYICSYLRRIHYNRVPIFSHLYIYTYM